MYTRRIIVTTDGEYMTVSRREVGHPEKSFGRVWEVVWAHSMEGGG